MDGSSSSVHQFKEDGVETQDLAGEDSSSFWHQFKDLQMGIICDLTIKCDLSDVIIFCEHLSNICTLKVNAASQPILDVNQTSQSFVAYQTIETVKGSIILQSKKEEPINRCTIFTKVNEVANGMDDSQKEAAESNRLVNIDVMVNGEKVSKSLVSEEG